MEYLYGILGWGSPLGIASSFSFPGLVQVYFSGVYPASKETTPAALKRIYSKYNTADGDAGVCRLKV